jgi:hypothetical protein
MIRELRRKRLGIRAIARTVGCSREFIRKCLAPARKETPPEKRRERRHACRYPFVRKVAGNKYQLRLYIGGAWGPGTSVNLGLYDSEWKAGQAFKAVARVLRGPTDPLSIWHQVRPLMAAGVLPPTILPMGVVRGPDGRYYSRRRGGSMPKERPGGALPDVVSAGPFDTPEEAYRAWVGSRRRPVGLTRHPTGPRQRT